MDYIFIVCLIFNSGRELSFCCKSFYTQKYFLRVIYCDDSIGTFYFDSLDKFIISLKEL